MFIKAIGIWILFVTGEPVAQFETREGCGESARYIALKYPDVGKIKCVRTTIITGGRRI